MEANQAHKERTRDMLCIRNELKERPDLIAVVKATIEAKLRRSGERLYRGDRSLLALAQKHCLSACSHLSGTDKSAWVNMKGAVHSCRAVLQYALGQGPAYKLPEREMFVADFLDWCARMHTENRSPIVGLMPPSSGMVSGLHYGAVRFQEPEAADQPTHIMIMKGVSVPISDASLIWKDFLIGAWVVQCNHTVASARNHRKIDECTYSISKHAAVRIREAIGAPNERTCVF